MSKNNILLNNKNRIPDWVTIREAVKIANKVTFKKITGSDIYRHALYGNINLSIYFQSPIILQKVKLSGHKIKLKPVGFELIRNLCLLDSKSFLNKWDLIVSTEGKYIIPSQRVIDTTLSGYEYVLIQRLLARSLNIPLPITGANDINYGISVNLSDELFLVFEKLTWQERIKQQAMLLPESISSDVYAKVIQCKTSTYTQMEYFPLHDLPQDACFVIRYTELEKLINVPLKNAPISQTSTRISTPLSRMFWLACKHNEAISPLIKHPYKLLSIFEQWASDDGITDHLSGDTLKAALERGSPATTPASN